jgi:hypothetical protein
MKKLIFIFAIVATFACENADDFDDWDGGVDGGCFIEPECIETAWYCEGNVLLQCIGGVWRISENCLAGGGVCVTVEGDLVADCLYPS